MINKIKKYFIERKQRKINKQILLKLEDDLFRLRKLLEHEMLLRCLCNNYGEIDIRIFHYIEKKIKKKIEEIKQFKLENNL